MSTYLDYLKTVLPSSWSYVEEQQLNWDGSTTTLILKSQTGTVYANSKVTPFQLLVLTPDPLTVKGILDVFIASYTNTFITLGLNTAKQNFFTPIIPTVSNPTGNTLTSQVILTGTLVESFGVSDIKEIKINNVAYQTTSRRLNLVSNVDSNGNINDTKLKQKSNVLSSSVQLQFSMINDNGTFCASLRSIRNGSVAPTSTYTVAIKFTDNDTVETYTMIVSSATLTSENTDMPVLTVIMMEAN